MQKASWSFVLFLLLVSSLSAVAELEPNDSFDSFNVFWCENGQHSGVANHPADYDFWYFQGFPGDTLTVSTLGQTTLDTVVEIRNAAGAVLAVNDDYYGTPQSFLSWIVPNDEEYYVVFHEYYGNVGDYLFTVSGLFVAYDSPPTQPEYFNIPHGATNVDVNTMAITWQWGDGCYGGSWNFFFGLNPTELTQVNLFPNTAGSREDGIALSYPLIGGFTYYYKIMFMGPFGWSMDCGPYSFTTAPYYLPVPFLEDFNTEPVDFASSTPNSPWFWGPVDESNPGAIFTMVVPNADCILIEKGSHNLLGASGVYFSFKHIVLMEPQQDHAYIEFSTNGGGTWAILPASAYRGSGLYAIPSANDPEGPCFDSGSYANWYDWAIVSNFTDYWHTETFDITPWVSSSEFRLRFRASWDNDEVGRGWIIDDFEMNYYAPIIPHLPSPVSGSTLTNTNLRLSWQSQYAAEYDIAFGTNPAALNIYTVTQPGWDALNLSPYTTYFWQVRSRNSYQTSQWSTLWSFSTQQYVTPWHQNSNLWISRMQFGSIDNSSGWNGYTNYSALSTNAQCGVDIPIYVTLAGGYGPEAVRVWVDVNRDAVFSNNPADGEYWDLSWGGGNFTGMIHLPSHLVASASRMRIQTIHTDGTDILSPAGVFLYGETEDYLLNTTDNPVLNVSPVSASFAPTPIGAVSAPVRFTFSNAGGQSLDITLTGITGANSSSFRLTEGNAYPIHLTTNLASVDIEFAPTSPGALSASLMVRDNLTRTDHYYSLSGSGVDLNPAGALSFDGSGEYVSTASAAPLQNLAAVTLETWFKWDSGSPIQFITAKNTEELEIHTNGSNNSLRFIPTNGVYIDSQANAIIPGQWQHIACVYNPAVGLAKIYVDGVDKTWQNNGSNPLTTPLQSSTSSFRLGIRQNGLYPLAGSMDEVRVWNTALSLEQIRNNMHLLLGRSNSGLVANWRLNELSGTVICDQIQSLNGTMMAMETSDRTNSPVVIGEGSSATLTPSVTATPYSFPGTGMQLSFTRLDSPGDITITRLTSGNRSEVFSTQSWLMRSYDTVTRIADVTCSVAEDVTSAHLPAVNFSLMGRNPDTSAAWTLLNHANIADVATNTITFQSVQCQTRQARIEWALLAPPDTPENFRISINGTNAVLHWNEVPGATRYKVLSCATPLGEFTENLGGVFSGTQWTAPLSAAKLFYKVIAVIE